MTKPPVDPDQFLLFGLSAPAVDSVAGESEGVRTYRYKVQSGGFGLFLGVSAEAVRTTTSPAVGTPVTDRIWLDASEISSAHYGNRITLTASEVAWLRFGLSKVADRIEHVDRSPYVLIRVRALEIFEADYAEAVLAPAIAGWAEAEFSLTPHRMTARRDSATGQYTFDWDE
ncbi:hypothetical protein ACIQNU_17275 [Streptomyces sp. NPDC091292]|uniref:hypothetical protein n=1 Tax=Streptomyces sp. NPDC091292 TaxID=3365991 RepID=UPI0037F3E4D1